MPVLTFWNGATVEEFWMKKTFAILAIAVTVAGATATAASARNHRHHHHGWYAELRGNYANSAGGRNSAVNSRNAGSRP
jgi:hypothetical protein